MTNTYIIPADYWDARARQGIGMAECGVLQTSLRQLMEYRYNNKWTILEVGTGDGRIYQYWKERNHWPRWERYHGCDISAEWAKLCEERTGLHVDVYDGITLPYDDDSFDWVISFSVLLHVPPADVAQHVAELVRVARRYVFVSTYTGTSEGLAPHCFAHDYGALFGGLRVIEYRRFVAEQNAQWLIAV